MFEKDFDRYVCEGDTIEARISMGGYSTGLRLVATIILSMRQSPEPISCLLMG